LCVVSTVHHVWLQDVVATYSMDKKAQEIMEKLAAAPDHTFGPFKLVQGVIRVKGAVWIGNILIIHHGIFQAFRTSPIGGHSGFPVTYRRFRSLFRWVGMRQFFKQQVQSCMICQQAKPEQILYPGKLQPLCVPQGVWKVVTMDFIERLPTLGSFNAIIVFVDTFTKYAHFIPLEHPFTAAHIVDVS